MSHLTGLTPDTLTHPQSAMAFRSLSIDVPNHSFWLRCLPEFLLHTTKLQDHGQTQHMAKCAHAHESGRKATGLLPSEG